MVKSCYLGPIVRHKNFGFGFKISFSDVKVAQRYKEMLGWFAISDKLVVDEGKGYYDRKE